MFSVFLTESVKFNVKKVTKYMVLKKNYRFVFLDRSLKIILSVIHMIKIAPAL